LAADFYFAMPGQADPVLAEVTAAFYATELDYLSVTIRCDATQGAVLSLAYSNDADDVAWNEAENGVVVFPFNDGLTHHVAVTTSATEILTYVNGVLLHTGTFTELATATTLDPSASVSVAEGASVSHVAFYPEALDATAILTHWLVGGHGWGHPTGERSGARIDRVLDECGWPTADRVLSKGDTVHGAYLPNGETALGYIRSVEMAEQGLSFGTATGCGVSRLSRRRTKRS
jgi:hypothetical protein